MPRVVVAEAELARRAQHAVRPLAPQLAPVDLHAVGHRRAERGQRHEVADGHVERAAADLQRLAVAGVDVDELDLVGVGVRRAASSTSADDDAVEPPRRRASTSSTGDAEVAQRVAERDRRRRSNGANSLQPGQAAPSSELLQEADVVGEQLAQVVDAVALSGEAVDAEAEREARSTPRGRCRSCASTFGCTMPQPPSSSHEPSGRWMSNSADGSVNGKYDGRSRERKPRAEERLGERLDRAGQVGEGDAPVDRPGPRSGGTPACGWRRRCRCRNTRPGHDRCRSAAAASASPGSAPATCGCAARRSRARRGRRRACRTCSRAGWSRRHVERVEVVPVGLDLGAFGDREARGRRTRPRAARWAWVTRWRWPRVGVGAAPR